MTLGYAVEWNYEREDGLCGSDKMNFQTKEEVDAFVEEIKSNPYKMLQFLVRFLDINSLRSEIFIYSK